MRIYCKADLYGIRTALCEDLREAYEIHASTPLDTPENIALVGEIADRIQAAQAFLHSLEAYLDDLNDIENKYRGI